MNDLDLNEPMKLPEGGYVSVVNTGHPELPYKAVYRNAGEKSWDANGTTEEEAIENVRKLVETAKSCGS